MSKKHLDVIELLSKLSTIKLSAAERSLLWLTIENRITEHAIMHTGSQSASAVTLSPLSRLYKRGGRIPSSFTSKWTHNKLRMGTIAGLLMLSVSGSVAAASHTALPGDLLYPVKVHVTEQVESMTKISPEAHASFESDLATRRLDEALALKARGTLSVETKADLEAEANTHATHARQKIAQISAEGKTDEAARLETTLSESVGARLQLLETKDSAPEEVPPSTAAPFKTKAKIDTSIQSHALITIPVKGILETSVQPPAKINVSIEGSSADNETGSTTQNASSTPKSAQASAGGATNLHLGTLGVEVNDQAHTIVSVGTDPSITTTTTPISSSTAPQSASSSPSTSQAPQSTTTANISAGVEASVALPTHVAVPAVTSSNEVNAQTNTSTAVSGSLGSSVKNVTSGLGLSL